MKKILSTVLALAILLSSTTLVTPSLAYTSYIEEVVLLVNEARAENGLSPLYVHPDLTSAAAIRALELDQYFSHDRPDGSSCFTVYDTELTYSYSYAGENIAQGHTTPADVVKAWLNSPGHNANIMNTNFDTIGVGYSATKRSWVQMFTSSSGGSPGTLLDGPTGNLVATSITLSATSLALGIGDTTTISGWIVPSSLSLSWSSSDPSVASVSSNGTVTPKSEGVAIITASGGGLTETCTVTVTTTTPEPIVPVELFDFNPSRLTMLVGESNTLNVHFYPSNATEKGVIYSSQDPSIVTVTTDGVATAISAGIGIITGTTVDGSITKSCTITVDDSNLKANYFTLSKNQVALNVGETTSITATFSPITATNTDLV
ncbi:MAG: Ig-like domain-containing protein, partial [Eubacteriales bacterium]